MNLTRRAAGPASGTSRTARAGACTAVAMAVSMLIASGAAAAPWKELTPGQPISALAAPGVARTGDGALHVLWPREDGAGASLQHTGLSASGTGVSGPNQVFSFTNGISQSAAVMVVDEGLRAFFSGLMGTNTQPQQIGMETALSTDGGASWSPSPTIVSNNSSGGRSEAYTAGISAARAPGNLPIFAWGDTAPGSAGYHTGLDPAAADVHFGSPTVCCEYYPGVAVDGATGAAFLAWKYIYGNGSGTVAQALGSLGELAPPQAGAVEAEIRTAITGRIGAADVFLAYQRGTNQFLSRPAVWNVSDQKLVDDGRFKRQGKAQAIGISAGPSGRLWVFYRRGSRLYATRSNTKATRFGEIVSVPTLSGAPQLLNLVGEGSRGPLDLVAVFRNASGSSLWHRRLLPGLSLSAKVSGHTVTATVTDAGAKVKGAKVKLAGKSSTTGPSGKVTFTAVGSGRYTMVASKAGYTPAKRPIRIR